MPRSSSGRKRHWGRFAVTQQSSAPGAQVIADLESLVEAELGRLLVDATAIRVIGHFVIRNNAAGLTAVPYAIGIVVHPEAGQADIPDPELDDAAWLYYAQRHTHSARTASEYTWDVLDIDNRSSRKIPGSAHRLLLSFTNVSASHTLLWSFSGRVLLLD